MLDIVGASVWKEKKKRKEEKQREDVEKKMIKKEI